MEYVAIGRLRKPHGLQGEMKGELEERFWDDVAEVEAFFVEYKGAYTPFFIEYLRGKGTPIVKFEDIDSKEDARAFTNKTLFLRKEDISLTDEEINASDLEYGFLESYTMVEEELGEIGVILRVDEFPQQEMATVVYQEKEVLIPLLEAWVVTVDKANKTVVVALPEGLLEV